MLRSICDLHVKLVEETNSAQRSVGYETFISLPQRFKMGPKKAAAFMRGACASVALLTGLVVAGCSPGYPTEDLVSDELMAAQDHVESLNDLSADVARHVRHRVELVGDCLLRFVYDKPRQSRDVMEIPLLSLQSTSKTDAQPG